MKAKGTPWVVFKLPEGLGVIYCDRCGDTCNLRAILPCALDVYLGAAQGFAKAHSACRQRVDAPCGLCFQCRMKPARMELSSEMPALKGAVFCSVDCTRAAECAWTRRNK